MNKLKKSISILLVFLMACVIIPSFNQVNADTVVIPQKGTYIQFGHYNGVPIVWRVLDVNEKGLLLLSDKVITLKAFDVAESGHSGKDSGTYKNNSELDVQKWGSNRWKNSNLREWLNSNSKTVNYSTYAPTNDAVYGGYNDYDKEAGFLTNLSQTEKSAINEVQNETEVFDVNTQKILATKDITKDNVFLLSYDDANNKYFKSDTERIASLTAESAQKSEYEVKNEVNWYYWLRSPSHNYSYNVNYVNYNGHINYGSNAYSGATGVRPALYLKSEISISGGSGTADSPYVFTGVTPQKGTYIQFGRYNGVPIVWRVLDVNEKGLLLLSDKIITLKAFDAAESGHSGKDSGTYKNNSELDLQRWGSNKWGNSNLREWLNSDSQTVKYSTCAPTNDAVNEGYNDYDKEAGFLTNLSQTEKSAINEVQNETEVWDVNTEKIANTKDITKDKVFLLSYDDANNYFKSDTERIAILTAESAQKSEYEAGNEVNWDYWLRSPSNDCPGSVNDVYNCGKINIGNYYYYVANYGAGGVRPALYLKAESSILGGNGTADSPFVFAGINTTGMPQNTVVIGKKAFPVKLLFKNNQIVIDAWNVVNKDNNKVFFKQKGKEWIDLNNKGIDKSVIPQVDYIGEDMVITVTYGEYDGNIVK